MGVGEREIRELGKRVEVREGERQKERREGRGGGGETDLPRSGGTRDVAREGPGHLSLSPHHPLGKRRPRTSPRAGGSLSLEISSSTARLSNANAFFVAFYFYKTHNVPLACHLHLEGET